MVILAYANRTWMALQTEIEKQIVKKGSSIVINKTDREREDRESE